MPPCRPTGGTHADSFSVARVRPGTSNGLSCRRDWMYRNMNHLGKKSYGHNRIGLPLCLRGSMIRNRINSSHCRRHSQNISACSSDVRTYVVRIFWWEHSRLQITVLCDLWRRRFACPPAYYFTCRELMSCATNSTCCRVSSVHHSFTLVREMVDLLLLFHCRYTHVL